ncbi:MAG: hypothetical protein R2713_20140 [Ilumatobacteraceae bacterium]
MRGERLFVLERAAHADQFALVMRDASDPVAPGRVLLDPAGLAADAAVAIDWYEPNDDGTTIAVGLSEGGTEESTLRVLDVATATLGDLAIGRTRACSVAWHPDGGGFWYTVIPMATRTTAMFASTGWATTRRPTQWCSGPIGCPHPRPGPTSPCRRTARTCWSRSWSAGAATRWCSTTWSPTRGAPWSTASTGERVPLRRRRADRTHDGRRAERPDRHRRARRADATALAHRRARASRPGARRVRSHRRPPGRGGGTCGGRHDRALVARRPVDRPRRRSGSCRSRSSEAVDPDDDTSAVFATVSSFAEPTAVWRIRDTPEVAGAQVARWCPAPPDGGALPALTVSHTTYSSLDGTDVGLFLIHRTDVVPGPACRRC